MVVFECASRVSFLMVLPKDRVLKLKTFFRESLTFVKRDYLLFSRLDNAPMQVEFFVLLNRVELATCPHEVKVDIHIFILGCFTLGTFNYRWVFIAA